MLGALIGGGTSILGGFLANKSAEKAAKQTAANQREFAQNGIQWKVQDAEKAGIHPLYALGANTHSFSPSNVGSTALGEGIAQAGQGIARAVDTGRTTNERMSARANELALQRGELENQKLASEIALMNQAGTPPAPLTENPVVPGTNVTIQPPNQSTTMPGVPSRDPAVNPDQSFARSNSGYAPVPNQATKQLIEDNMLNELAWSLRNQIMPSFGITKHTTRPPNSWLPLGSNTWKWDVTSAQWRPWNSHTKTYGRNSNLGGR